MSSVSQTLASVTPLWGLEQYVAVHPFWGQLHRPAAEVATEFLSPRKALPRLDDAARLLGPFLASYFSPATGLLPSPWEGLPLWTAWRASLPSSLAAPRKARRLLQKAVALLPDRPSAALAVMGADQPARLTLLLDQLPGWASSLRAKEWPGTPAPEGPLASLAAMVAALDEAGLVNLDPAPVTPQAVLRPDAEESLRRAVQARLRPQPEPVAAPELRAAFCIDVRSEPFRRHWEAADPRVATEGFAGFFGLPLAWDEGSNSTDHLPVLLSPVHRLKAPRRRYRPALAWGGTPNFPLVELLGWTSGVKLLLPLRRRAPWKMTGVEAAVATLDLEAQVTWAEGFLRALGWHHRWAPVMALVGHGSSSRNNPHAASLDCGACGGRSGELSVRVGAAILNRSEVREGLAARGVDVPDSTRFVAGLHDTTLDAIAWFGDDLEAFRPGLDEAHRRVAAEKKVRFGFARGEAAARDGAETRPEAGLAGNAVFLVAPRSVSRGVDLGGRAFLHSYDADEDPEGGLLTTILTAPMVVASWISWQYLASTVAPDRYGAGDKVLHTRLGSVGVLEGIGGDLKAGLPLQSLFAKGGAYHEPLRLQVLVVAPVDRVARILGENAVVGQLVDHGWVHLSVRDAEGRWWEREDGEFVPREDHFFLSKAAKGL